MRPLPTKSTSLEKKYNQLKYEPIKEKKKHPSTLWSGLCR